MLSRGFISHSFCVRTITGGVCKMDSRLRGDDGLLQGH
jgi:hypothetical protein